MFLDVREETLESLFKYYSAPDSGLRWPSVFALPVWLQTWWKVFGKDYELYICSVWQDHELIGIAPLMRREQEVFFLGSPDVCDYLDFIVVPGKEKEFLQGLFMELEKRGIERLELSAQRPDSVIFVGLFLSADNCKYSVQFHREDQSYEIPLADNWGSYLDGLNKKQRHEVRRKLRRLENETVDYRYRVIGDSGAIENYKPYFFEFFQQNSEKERFLTDRMKIYFSELISNTARAGLSRFGLLEIEGAAVAVVLYFDYRESVYLYNSGYSSDHGALSVGLLSKIFSIRDSIEQGRQVYDFLKGEEVYKSRLGGTAIPIYKVEITIS